MNLWFGGVLLVLLMPVYLVNALGPNVPQSVRTILPWIPTVLLSKVVRFSFSASVPLDQVLPALGVVVGSAVAVLAVVVWVVRRSDR
jgi:hypothetical protein